MTETSKAYTVREVDTEFGKVFLMLPSTLPLGSFHDILMSEKAWAVGKMQSYHDKEEEVAKEHFTETKEGQDGSDS